MKWCLQNTEGKEKWQNNTLKTKICNNENSQSRCGWWNGGTMWKDCAKNWKHLAKGKKKVKFDGINNKQTNKWSNKLIQIKELEKKEGRKKMKCINFHIFHCSKPLNISQNEIYN